MALTSLLLSMVCKATNSSEGDSGGFLAVPLVPVQIKKNNDFYQKVQKHIFHVSKDKKKQWNQHRPLLVSLSFKERESRIF